MNFGMKQVLKRVYASEAEEAQGAVRSSAEQSRDRTERQAAGSHAGRVWIRGFYRRTANGQVWVRGHFAAPTERHGRSGAE